MESTINYLGRYLWPKLVGLILVAVSYCASSTSSSFNNLTQLALNTSRHNNEPKQAMIQSQSPVLSLHTIFTLVLPYSVIFVLAVIGNLLVIITLTFNRSMRSVTNLFLLNLAIADLLLGVFCMPFTLVGVLLRRFIFGSFMCHAISYLQAVSVAVSVWTLVVMSVERYYAICHPLQSRERRQTRRHAYRILATVWTMALLLMSPTAIVSQLQLIPQTGYFKCREAWSSFFYKQVFTIFLDLILLIAPLFMMIFTYASIGTKLHHNLRHQVNCQPYRPSNVHKTTSFITPKSTETIQSCSSTSSLHTKCSTKICHSTHSTLFLEASSNKHYLRNSSIRWYRHRGPRSRKHKEKLNSTLRVNSSYCATQGRQRRIIGMLIAVVVEFFVCWTPIFTMDTWALYQPKLVYRNLSQWFGFDIISACHLLCFCSSCTNPITYCFMNRRFRRHFLALFRCSKMSPQMVANHTTQTPFRGNGFNQAKYSFNISNRTTDNSTTLHVPHSASFTNLS